MSIDAAKQALESVANTKTTLASVFLGYGPAVAATNEAANHARETAAQIDYSSPAVFIPLSVAVIAGVYHLMLIYKLYLDIKTKK